MPKRAISVTLEAENITWLRGRARAAGARSLSELLDGIVTAARAAGHGVSRSVVGTIDIAASDPLLEQADVRVRSLFESALGRRAPGRRVVHEDAGRRRTRRKNRG